MKSCEIIFNYITLYYFVSGVLGNGGEMEKRRRAKYSRGPVVRTLGPALAYIIRRVTGTETFAVAPSLSHFTHVRFTND